MIINLSSRISAPFSNIPFGLRSISTKSEAAPKRGGLVAFPRPAKDYLFIDRTRFTILRK